jgi:hypothetical protein
MYQNVSNNKRIKNQQLSAVDKVTHEIALLIKYVHLMRIKYRPFIHFLRCQVCSARLKKRESGLSDAGTKSV